MCGAQRYERSPDRIDTRAGNYERTFHSKAGEVKLKMPQVSAMLKAIHAQESREAAQDKAKKVVEEFRAMRLQKAADLVERCLDETLGYYSYPQTHWLKIRTNNPLERIMREIRRRTRVVGASPDGESAVMLVGARLRHIASTKWGTRKYMSMDWLRQQDMEAQQSA